MDHHLDYCTVDQIKQRFTKDSWQRKSFLEFAMTLRSSLRPFP